MTLHCKDHVEHGPSPGCRNCRRRRLEEWALHLAAALIFIWILWEDHHGIF